MSNAIANTILQQIGGNRFIAMTGARQFVALDAGLQFSLPRGRKVRVSLVNDLYELEVFTLRNFEVKRQAFAEGIYADRLAAAFTELTGLDTRL